MKFSHCDLGRFQASIIRLLFDRDILRQFLYKKMGRKGDEEEL